MNHNPNLQVKNSENHSPVFPVNIPTITTFSGPVPPPIYLQEYEKLYPGISEKFLEGPFIESQHRRKTELYLIEEQFRLFKRGQWMAYSLAILCIISAFLAIFTGYDIAGLGALFISCSVFAGVFLIKNRSQK